MIHQAKLLARLGPSPAVAQPWFLAWSLWHFVGAPGGYSRPPFPKHLTTNEFPGVFDEWARLVMWRQRKQAGLPHPAVGLWVGGRLPPWAITVSKEMDKHGVKPAPPPAPPTPQPSPNPNPQLVDFAQNVLFTAWRPGDGLRAPHGKLAISADLGLAGDHLATSKTVCEQAKEQGKFVAAWANQSQVGIGHLLSFGQEINADYLIWQAETIGEMVDVGVNMDGSTRAGSPIAVGEVVLIGNANAWTDAQRKTATALVNNGRLAFIQETYTNCGDPWPDAYGTQGVPAASISPGVGWDRWPYQLPEYKQHTPPAQWPTISPYLAEDFHDESWAILP